MTPVGVAFDETYEMHMRANRRDGVCLERKSSEQPCRILAVVCPVQDFCFRKA